MMKQLLIIIFYLNGIAYGQNIVTGSIYDEKTSEPISNVTVYVNGSNKGSKTDYKGFFTLQGVKAPFLLVVSHLSYELKTIKVETMSTNLLNINLTEKKLELAEVTILSKSSRKDCVKKFSDAFLGIDRWGSRATLLNDSVLYFTRETDTTYVRKKTNKLSITNGLYNTDSIMVLNHKFITSAKAPLQVELPLTGYTLSVDLLSFSISETKDDDPYCYIQGYFYFKPYENNHNYKQAKFEKNRRLAYYNSPMHLNRAIFNNKLLSNGYVVFRDSFIVLDTMLYYHNQNEAYITGQKGKEYSIFYFGCADGRPVNLTNTKQYNFESFKEFFIRHASELKNDAASRIKFLEDTCEIRSNGTTEHLKFLIKGSIAEKRVGAMLPDDYDPAEY